MERGCNHYRRVSEFGGLMVLSLLMSPGPQNGAATVLGVLLSPGSLRNGCASPGGAARFRRPPEKREYPGCGGPRERGGMSQESQGSCQAQHAQERGSHGGPGPYCCQPTMQEQQPRGQHLPTCPWGSHHAPQGSHHLSPVLCQQLSLSPNPQTPPAQPVHPTSPRSGAPTPAAPWCGQ